MFRELHDLHARSLEGIAELAELTRMESPDWQRLAPLRVRLTRLSRARLHYLEEAIYPALLGHVSPADTVRLKSLRSDNLAARRASADHIASWSMDKIRADWSGYRRASNQIRASMQARVAIEKDILYPLLDPMQSALQRRRTPGQDCRISDAPLTHNSL